ncbi:hypothetical protein LguiA_008002 [Lonicera macranthoides]
MGIWLITFLNGTCLQFKVLLYLTCKMGALVIEGSTILKLSYGGGNLARECRRWWLEEAAKRGKRGREIESHEPLPTGTGDGDRWRWQRRGRRRGDRERQSSEDGGRRCLRRLMGRERGDGVRLNWAVRDGEERQRGGEGVVEGG